MTEKASHQEALLYHVQNIDRGQKIHEILTKHCIILTIVLLCQFYALVAIGYENSFALRLNIKYNIQIVSFFLTEKQVNITAFEYQGRSNSQDYITRLFIHFRPIVRSGSYWTYFPSWDNPQVGPIYLDSILTKLTELDYNYAGC